MSKARSIHTRFLHDVRHHQMTILLDQGLHRHIAFSRPDSSILSFSLVTWPGHLAISGDCQDYTFRRLSDMFDFFRHADPGYEKEDRIDPDYWAEKIVATSRHGGHEIFSEDLYKSAIVSDFLNGSIDMTPADRRAAWRDMRETLLDALPCDRGEAVHQAMGYRCPVRNIHPFEEFWDHCLVEPSFGFLWACHAIQWGIKRYDLLHQGRSQADRDRMVLSGAA